MRKLLLTIALLVLAPGWAWAQSTVGLPPACTVDVLTGGGCAIQTEGMRARVVDGLNSSDCVTGGGTTAVVCELDGASGTWRPAGSTNILPSERIQFCGEQGANTDTFYQGPNLVSQLTGAIPTAHNMGGALCNALGSTTSAATVDNDIDPDTGYHVDGMFCKVSAAPGTAVTVITLLDDTVATAVTCSIGDTETSCYTDIGAEVAADSQMATSTLNGTDDESAQDVTCFMYFTWRP